MTADTPRLRLGILAIVGLSMFAALGARLWYLQVLASDEYQIAAERNQVRVVPIQAPRGRILDRHGRVLVDNRASNVVTVSKAELDRLDDDDQAELLERLSALITVPASDLRQRIEDPRNSPYTPVAVAEDVGEDIMVRLLERRDHFLSPSGRSVVDADRLALRAYPHGPLAAHLLGYVGEVGDAELEAKPGEYALGDMIGKAGIELAYEKDLRGRDGELRVEVDANGVPVRVLDRTAPVQGDDVVLSLDLDLQVVAEQSLAQGLEAARGRRFADTKAPLVADAGAAVVLDAQEGSVVAMASYPTFDPGQLVNGISSAEAEVLFQTEPAPFTNRATQGQYAPGSTWKLVTALSALRSGLITPQTTVNDQGSFTIESCGGKCRFQNAGAERFGLVDLPRALAVSSDVYFYKQGHDMWVQRSQLGETALQEGAALLGFGAETGMPISEADGRVPTPARRAQLHEENPVAFPEGRWFIGDNVNLAIGQGELVVTPVQLANAYATFANGGTRFAPNVALRVQDQDGDVVREIKPRVAERIDLAPHQRDAVMDGLVRALRDPRGTGYGAFAGFPLDQFPVAGKTGTAQAKPKQDTALFVAVAPPTEPRYVVSVVMEQAGFGATSAAPVARRVLGVASGLEPYEPVTLVAGGRG